MKWGPFAGLGWSLGVSVPSNHNIMVLVPFGGCYCTFFSKGTNSINHGSKMEPVLYSVGKR